MSFKQQSRACTGLFPFSKRDLFPTLTNLVSSATVLAHELNTSAYEAKTAKPLANEELVVAFSLAPPFVIVDNGFENVKGIDVDIARELQKRTGFKLKNNRFDIMNFGELIDLATRGEIDIAGGGITLNDDRAKKFNLLGPIVSSSSVVVVKDHQIKVNSIKDLQGHKVATEMGTTSADIIPPDSDIKVNLNANASLFMCFYSVATGQADSLIADAPIAYDYVKGWKEGNLKLAFALPDTISNLGLLTTKKPKVSAALQQAFNEMCQDGTVEKIVNSYFSDHGDSDRNHFSLSEQVLLKK